MRDAYRIAEYTTAYREGKRARGLYDAGFTLDGMGRQVFPKYRPFKPLTESLREYYSRKLETYHYFPSGTPTLWRRAGTDDEIQDVGNGWGLWLTTTQSRAFRWARFEDFAARHLEGRRC